MEQLRDGDPKLRLDGSLLTALPDSMAGRIGWFSLLTGVGFVAVLMSDSLPYLSGVRARVSDGPDLGYPLPPMGTGWGSLRSSKGAWSDHCGLKQMRSRDRFQRQQVQPGEVPRAPG
jgi:hypothetical protein